jgi:putative transposase
VARLPRLVVAGQAHHVVLAGLPDTPVVRDDEDRAALVAAMAHSLRAQSVPLHAYAVLDDGLQLLVTPADAGSLARAMQALGRQHVAGFNRRHGRRGTLWAGRYRAGVVDGSRWLTACMAFIETAPVRAGLVGAAPDWAWSSAAHHVGRRHDAVVTEPAAYWALGNTPFERELAWRQVLEQGLSPKELEAVAHASQHGWALGGPAFMAELAAQTRRPLRPRPRGRPRKAAGA